MRKMICNPTFKDPLANPACSSYDGPQLNGRAYICPLLLTSTDPQEFSWKSSPCLGAEKMMPALERGSGNIQCSLWKRRANYFQLQHWNIESGSERTQLALARNVFSWVTAILIPIPDDLTKISEKYSIPPSNLCTLRECSFLGHAFPWMVLKISSKYAIYLWGGFAMIY